MPTCAKRELIWKRMKIVCATVIPQINCIKLFCNKPNEMNARLRIMVQMKMKRKSQNTIQTHTHGLLIIFEMFILSIARTTIIVVKCSLPFLSFSLQLQSGEEETMHDQDTCVSYVNECLILFAVANLLYVFVVEYVSVFIALSNCLYGLDERVRDKRVCEYECERVCGRGRRGNHIYILCVCQLGRLVAVQ